MGALRRRTAGITCDARRYPAAVPGPRATRRALLAAGLASTVVACLADPAAAQSGPSVDKSPLLWSTVNVCDTATHPDTVGVRGSMPGSGVAKEQMFMRFQLQYFEQAAEEWRSIGDSGDSGFVPVGSGRYKQRQTGRNFTVRPPRTGAFILRGVVSFEWRLGGKVVRRAVKGTTSKHGSTAGADPAGFSAAKCDVRA